MIEFNNGWQVKSLGEVADFIKTGKTPSTTISSYFGGEVPWYTPNDIGMRKLLVKTERTLTKKAVVEGKAILFPKDTLLITCIGNIGRVGILNKDSSSNQQITGIKFNSSIDVNYAYYWFKKNSFQLTHRANQAVVPILNNSQLKEIKISYPPPPIQKQIAEILEKADEAKQKRKESNKLTDEFLQSVFIEMFGDPVKNPKGWEAKKIKELVSIPLQNGAYFTEEKYTVDESKGIEMVHMSDAFYETVKSGGLKRVIANESEIEKYELKNGDILIARRSLTFEGAAKACLVQVDTIPLLYESSFIRIRVDSKYLLPIYVFYFFSNENARKAYVLKYVTSSTISGINQTNLAEVTILVPPLSLQQQFVEIVNKTEALKEKQKQSEQELENLFQSLMQKAFKGELLS